VQLEELENTEATDADELERQSMQARHCYLTILTMTYTQVIATEEVRVRPMTYDL
tara:strand:- start:211 stop:375 length:165 start_codon:yes stop_codon:yes gene_type:complete